MIRRAAAAIALLIGCSGPTASDDGSEVLLRVSAAAGLSELMPGIEASGASAAAIDLVFPEIDAHIESLRVQGDRIILLRRASSPLSSRQVAAALRGKELLSAHAVDDRQIEARFRDEKTAALVAEYRGLGLDIGPFRVAEQDDKHIRLVRRGESSIDAIEIIASSRADEWRKLLARELDVVPWADGIYRHEFDDVKSIRLLDIPATNTATLFFNVRAPELADAAVRRRIAAAIHRPALARLVCGDPACAVSIESPEGEARLPAHLSVILPRDVSTFVTAAKVIRHQLFQSGVELAIEPLPLAEYMTRVRGDFVLALGPLTMDDRHLAFFLSAKHPQGMSFCNFGNDEFDAAYDRHDVATARAILDHEVPFTRLFENREFAAVDSAFCGDVTPSTSSWLWLAELYPCDEGPSP